MTHAAVLHTEQPDLQALFDEDWASGKYRRPKCSKADYYAGWLVAYERFRTVMATEKVAIVEKPAAAVDDGSWTPVMSQSWLEGVTFSDPRSEDRHRRIFVGWDDTIWRLSEYESGEWTIERKNPNAKHAYLSWDALEGLKALPLKTARVVASREIKGLPMPTKKVTHYQGALPLKRESPAKGRTDLLPSSAAGCSGQAIPDSMIRKLAIMAGRPEIAP